MKKFLSLLTLLFFASTAAFGSNYPTTSDPSTGTKQDTGNTSVASIDTKTPALGQALAANSTPVVLTAAQLSTLTPLSSVTVSDGAGALNVIVDSGTTTVTQGTGTNLHAVLDANSGVDIGKLTANQSTNISQINAVTPLMGNGATGTGSLRVTIADNNTAIPVATHAVTVASGGIASGAVASGAFASGALASGSVASGAIASGALAAGAITPGATSIAANEDTVSADADTLVKVAAIRDDTLDARSGTEGDYEPIHLNANGAIWGIDVNSAAALTSTQLLDDVIIADDAAFTPATTKVSMAGFEFDDSTPDSVDEGDSGAGRMSARRELYMQIRDAAGGERGVNVNASNQMAIAGPVTVVSGGIASGAVASGAVASGAYASGSIGSGAIASGAYASGSVGSGAIASGSIASGAIASGAIAAGAIANGATSIAENEDVASADADRGVKIFAIRDDTLNIRSGTEGDYEHLHTDANGALWADLNIAGAAAVSGSGNATGALRVELANNGTGLISTVSTVSALGVSTTGPQKLEDVASAGGDAGIAVYAVRTDTPVSGANASGSADYVPIITDSFGKTWVSATVPEDTAHIGAEAITMGGARRIDPVATSSGTDGDWSTINQSAEGALYTTDVPTTASGLSVANFTSGDSFTALTNTAQAIKASAGNLYGYYIYNPNSSATYVLVYNTAAASVTVGTTNPVLVFSIPATSGANLMFPYPITFSNAGWSAAAATTGGGNSAPATALEAMFWYK